MKKIILSLSILIAGITANAQDISGTYYVGEPNYDASLEHPWKRTYSEATIKFDKEKTAIEVAIDGMARNMWGSPNEFELEAVKAGKIYAFNMNNVGDQSLTNTSLLQIEPGVFVVASASTIDMGCTEVKRAVKSSAPSKGGKVYPVESLVREFILGKDKARVKALCDNDAEFEKLLADAVMAHCKAKNEKIGDKYPLPAEGMKDAGLKADVHTQIKAFATSNKWPQTVERSYIKSTDWTPLKQGAKILGREIRCVVIYSKNGACQWQEFSIQQDFNGSAYGKSYVQGVVPGGFSTPCK